MPLRALLTLAVLALLACSAPARRDDDDTTTGPGPVDCSQPGAASHAPPETCNGKDDDCDGDVDEADATDAKTWYRDVDGDGFGDATQTVKACTQPSGFVEKPGDCDDQRAGVRPGAAEVACNELDDDCSPATPDAADADHDGVTTCAGDCDDANPLVFPGNQETCNGLDDDCDGTADDGLSTSLSFRDADGDGFGNPQDTRPTCAEPAPGYVFDASDCDDTKANVHPGRTELTCNGVDDDCNPATVDGPDEDHDGVSICANDCDDHNPDRYPGRPEVCNGRDDDCDAQVDEDLPRAQYFPDSDRDGHGTVGGAITACGAPDGYAQLSDDCNDLRADVYPGAPEKCDGVDRNCDGKWSAVVPSSCATIQQAIDVSRAGATVTVLPGTYRENLDFKGLNVTVTSSAGPAQTIIDGGASGPVVTFKSGETASTVLSGFTLRNGSGVVDMAGCQQGHCPTYGGGILVNGASPTLQDLVITGNVLAESNYWCYGAGISLRNSQAVVKRTRIGSNTSCYYGGGVYVDNHSNVTFSQVRFEANHAGIGGGIANYYGQMTLTNVIFAGNVAGSDGGMFCQGCTMTATNVTAHGNTASNEGTFLNVSYNGSATLKNVAITSNTPTQGTTGSSVVYATAGSNVNLSYCLVNGNVGPWTGVADPTTVAGTNCINALPNYVSVSGSADLWNLHPGSGSPLINAGAPTLMDADGSRSDIGAYGGPGGVW